MTWVPNRTSPSYLHICVVPDARAEVDWLDAWLKKEYKLRHPVRVIGHVQTLQKGRCDFFFIVHADDRGNMERLKRHDHGITSWNDAYFNTGGSTVYPYEFRKHYPIVPTK